MPEIALTSNAAPRLEPAARADTSLRTRDLDREGERGPVGGSVGTWQGEAFSFGDLLDVINPLQHIPVVNKIYRGITGDEIGAAARIGGGALFGGIAGLVTSVADTVLEAVTGRDAADTVVAALKSGTMDDATETLGTDVAEILGYAAPTSVAARDDAAGSASDNTPHNAPGKARADAYADARAGTATPATAATPATTAPAATPVAARTGTPQPAVPVADRLFARFSTASPPPRNTAANTATPPGTPPGMTAATHARAVPPGTTVLSTSPQPLQTSVPLRGVRGVAQPSPRAVPALPNPQALAGDPGMVAKLRAGGWTQVLAAAQGTPPDAGTGTSRGGPNALATGTVARALAGYAAAADLPTPRQR